MGLVHFNHTQSAGQILQVSPTLSDAVFWYTSRSCASWNALVEARSALSWYRRVLLLRGVSCVKHESHDKPPPRVPKWRTASRAPIKACGYQSKITAPAAQTEVHVRNALVYSLLWKSSGGRATCATLRVIREALCASSFPYSLLLSLGLAISSKHTPPCIHSAGRARLAPLRSKS